MNRLSLCVGMLAMVLAWSSGCHCVQNRHEACGGSCGSCGGNPNDPILGDCNKCGVCGGKDCPGYTPAGYMKKMMTCSSGCSDIYWGEWVSDPPDCCDPCDNCAHWTGNCCRGGSVASTLKAMWGTRYCGDSCSSCGSGDCGGCGGGSHGGMHQGGHSTMMETGDDVLQESPREPVPAKRAPAEPPAKEPEEKAARPRSGRTTQAPPRRNSTTQNVSSTKAPWQPR